MCHTSSFKESHPTCHNWLEQPQQKPVRQLPLADKHFDTQIGAKVVAHIREWMGKGELT